MKFMLPVLLSLLITTALFSQKAGGSESSVPSGQTQTESPHISFANNNPNQTEAVTWSALISSGLRGVSGAKVNAILVVGADVYIGGVFSSTGGKTVNNIVRWDGTTFTAMGAGVGGNVNALAYFGGNIIVGGNFGSAGGNENIKYLAQWDGSSWSSIGGGVNNIVHALVVAEGVLYVAGEFTTANQTSGFNRIASWNGNLWTAYGGGFGLPVRALAVSGSTIYAAGSFTETNYDPGNYIAKWNGFAWGSLGTGMDSHVYSLILIDTVLYAGGAFNNAGGVSAYYIAKWNGTSWAALNGAVGGQVNSLAVHNSILYAGTQSNVRKYKAGEWSSMAFSLGAVRALAVNASDAAMYVGGEFQNVTPTEFAEAIELNKIAKFTDTDDPLPVELTSFSAKRVSGGVELRWTTATEVNNYGFEIERASATGSRNWEKIDFVPGNGNSNSPKQYIYKDNIGGDQSYIYRLKQIDTDGSFVYSGELHVNSGTPASFELKQNFPNPFNPATMISYSLPAAGMVQLKIYSTTGEEVSALVNELQEAGSYQISFNGSGLASGTYLYRITVSSTAGIYTQSRKMILLK